MNTLKKSLEDRNTIYHEETKKILRDFVEKLNKAVQYFVKIDREVEWLSVEFIPGTQNFVYLTGFLEIRKGDLLAHSGESRIEVDEKLLAENASAKTLVRIMVSIEDLETMDAKDLYGKIKDYYELSSLIPQDQIIRILGTNLVTDITEVLDEIKAVAKNIMEQVDAGELPVDENPTTTKEETSQMAPTDFDYSVLNEDQKKQIEFHKPRMSKLKN